MTYYIDEQLQIRQHPDGWPVIDSEMPSHVLEAQEKRLAQCKRESLVVEWPSYNDLHNAVIGLSIKPDTFIELSIECEFVRQHRFDGKMWFDYTGGDDLHVDCEKRTICRVNPQDEMSLKEEATLLASFTEDGQVRIQSAGGCLWTDDNDKDIESIEKGSGMYFPERQIADLKTKLTAAEKRVKELVTDAVNASVLYGQIDRAHSFINDLRAQLATAEKIDAGLKARILEAFALGLTFVDTTREYDKIAKEILSKSLDKIGVK